MPEPPTPSAQLVLPCADLNANMTFFTDVLGFRLDSISPADDPRAATVSLPGLSVRLVLGEENENSVTIRLSSRINSVTEAPNGTRIEFNEPESGRFPAEIKQSYVLSKYRSSDEWVTGRVGMQYRDLIPDRQNGRFIASHIKIADGSNIQDYPHFHNIRFQMIYCYKGWVRLVYEDQGDEFTLRQGDCVLQPPNIRHQVLESSAGLEVIEIGCPAEHDTFADNDIRLPTSIFDPERDFSGQKFIRFQRDDATWSPWHIRGYEATEFGFVSATKGMAAGSIVRPAASAINDLPAVLAHDEEFLFFFILDGSVSIACEGEGIALMDKGDACVIPSFRSCALIEPSSSLELLEVRLSGAFSRILEPMSLSALLGSL